MIKCKFFVSSKKITFKNKEKKEKKESKSIEHRKFAFFYSIEYDHSKRTQINR